MDKKSFAILLVASVCASSTFANNLFSKIINKQNSTTTPTVKAQKMTQQLDHPWTNFSGTWEVNCDGNSYGTTVIQNGMNYIVLDGEMYRIGKGVMGKSESNDEYTYSENFSYDWNEDGSALIAKGVIFNKENKDNSVIQTGISKFTLSMKNGQLNLDGTGIMFEDEKQVEQPMTEHCVFTKKQ